MKTHDIFRGHTFNIRGGELNATHVIGILGGIASGKSSVARRLSLHGAEIIDADRFIFLSITILYFKMLKMSTLMC